MRFLAKATARLKVELAAYNNATTANTVPKFHWDVLGLRTAVYRFFRYVLAEHHSPTKVGWAVFAGTLVGCSPFFGFHLLICIAAAFFLRLNQLIVYLAANISLPVFAPFLIFGCYQVGHLVLRGQFAPLSIDTIKSLGVDSFGIWLVGSMLVGPVLGSVFGATAYFTLRRLTRSSRLTRSPRLTRFSDPMGAVVADLHRGFKVNGPFAAGLAKSKVKHDIVYRTLLDVLPADQNILDLGGGQGYLCLLHALKHKEIPLQHQIWDWDERKLEQGRKAAAVLQLPDIEFKKVDIFATQAYPRARVVCLLDVLHYRPVDQQNRLLQHLAQALPPNGTLVIRDMNADHPWRTRWTILQERFSLLASLTKASKIYPQSMSRIGKLLQYQGLKVSMQPCWGGTPFSNYLLIATKD